MYIRNPIDEICLKNGIYKYLHFEDNNKIFREWCSKHHIDVKSIAAREDIIYELFHIIGYSAMDFFAIPSISHVIRNIKEYYKNAKSIKCLILDNKGNSNVVLSVIRNVIYVILCYPCHIISINKIIRFFHDVEKSTDYLFFYMRDLDDYRRYIGTEKDIFYTKRLIADYLVIKDFKNANHYATEFLSRGGYDKNNEISNLMLEVNAALIDLKNSADNKNVNHIVWNWIDNLRYNQLHNMPFMEKRIRDGIYFTNMYCVTPYTTAAMHTILTGKTFIDDGLWKLKKDDIFNGEFISKIKRKGYDFSYIGVKYDLMQEIYNISIPGCDSHNMPSTVLQYELLMRMAEYDKPTIFLVHNLRETHYPYINPEELAVSSSLDIINDINQYGYVTENSNIQIQHSQKYLDEQLEYFHKYYTKNIQYEIFFSDHGCITHRDKFVSDDSHHIFMGITGKEIDAKEITSIQSLNIFPYLMEDLLDNRIEDIGKEYGLDYVFIQHDDRYAKITQSDIDLIQSHGLNCLIMKAYFQHRGVLTKEDCYIRWAFGKEYYERNGNSENLIDVPEWGERIKYLRELAGNHYINMLNEPKYKDVVQLYDMLNISLNKDNCYV